MVTWKGIYAICHNPRLIFRDFRRVTPYLRGSNKCDCVPLVCSNSQATPVPDTSSKLLQTRNIIIRNNMESCDGPVLREIIGSSFTGEVPSVRDGPSVAVPPKTEKETDKRIPASACPEPEEPPTSSTFLPKQNGGHATLQQDDHAAPPQGLTTAPPPCGGYKVQTKEESKPRDGLTCVHCSLVLRNAMQTEDGCRVCLSCYQEVKYVFP